MPAADPAAAPPPRHRAGVVLAVAAFGVLIAADDLMVVATMLRPMVDDLGLVLPDDLDDTAWIVNAHLIAYLAVMPLAGRLSDVFGRRAVFVAALAAFLAGSLVVPTADSLAVLLAGRVLTAVGGGALVPVALAVAGDLYRGPARTRALGLLGAVETLGWVWGPLYGALLVRFASWRWQFHVNVPLALVGMAAGWSVLDPSRRARRHIGWAGPALLTAGLVALGLALLGEARVQAATGLEQLAGDPGGDPRGAWLYAAALVAFAALVVVERRSPAPLLDRRLLARRGPGAALAINALVGVGLVIALVNVPLFVNVVEGGVEVAAVRSGWLLTALTASMAVASYLGGVAAARFGHRVPVVAGLALAAGALAVVGLTWGAGSAAPVMAVELAVVGAGIGLVLAPTTAAVVDAARAAERGTAAALVLVARLVGFSVGLAALTAWGLRRYDQLRAVQELPPLGAPGFEEALATAAVDTSTRALGETFLGAALALAVAGVVAAAVGPPRRPLRSRARPARPPRPRPARSSSPRRSGRGRR